MTANMTGPKSGMRSAEESERHLGPLAVGKTLDPPIGDLGEPEQREERVAALVRAARREPMQLGEVADVLAGGEPRIEAVRVRKHAEPLARARRISHDVD